MTQSNIDRQFVQDPAGTLHAGVDLALEKNLEVVVNERAERLEHFSFPQDRGGYDYFLRRLEGLRQKHQAAKVVVAMEPTNYLVAGICLVKPLIERSSLTLLTVSTTSF